MHLGLAQLSQWEQAAQFDPTNPNQITRMQYAHIPGGYGTWYYNRVPTEGQLQGGGLRYAFTRQLNGLGMAWADVPPLVQAGLAIAVGALAGYVGWQKFGGTINKKTGLGGRRR